MGFSSVKGMPVCERDGRPRSVWDGQDPSTTCGIIQAKNSGLDVA